jgi:uncharacterized membrane protein
LYLLLLILHLMLIAIGTGMSFGNYVNLRIAATQTGERAAGLALLRQRIGRIGDVVITLIWLTGLALWGVRAVADAPQSGWFYLKLVFVLLLTVCHTMARRTAGRMVRTKDASLLGRIEIYVAGVWLSALASIVLAVIAFER